MNDREMALVKALGEEFSVMMGEMERKSAQELAAVKLAAEENLQQLAERVKKLEEAELPDIGRMLTDAVAELPAPVTPELPDIPQMVDESVTKAMAGIQLPVAPELPDIPLMVGEAVTKAVSAIELPVAPKLPDIPQMVDESVTKAMAGIQLPVAPELPDIPLMVGEAVTKAVSAIELPVAPKLPDIPLIVGEAVAKAIGSIELPVAASGKDGADALQLEVLPCIEETKNYPRGTYATHNGGLWRTYEKSHGMRGWECLVDGVAAVDIQQTDERNFSVSVTRASGEVDTKAFSMPAQIYREVFEKGQQYQPGDTVTWGGSLWHCNEATEDKPGEPDSKGWVLAVKKGRDLREKKT